MMVFVWERLSCASRNWHAEGGIVVFAADLEEAHRLLQADPDVPTESDVYTTEPTVSTTLSEPSKPRVFIFPDAGCC